MVMDIFDRKRQLAAVAKYFVLVVNFPNYSIQLRHVAAFYRDVFYTGAAT